MVYMTDHHHQYRESWLHDLWIIAAPYVRERTGRPLPSEPLRFSCGFPARGGTARKRKRTGQCFAAGETGRSVHDIFIHPALADPVAVGECLLHEALHAILPPGAGHRKPFSQAAKALGLLPEGAKPTATRADDELREQIEAWAEQLGAYPHESLTVGGGRTRVDPNRKVMCPICGYIARTTLVWLDMAGCPICPQCMTSMEEAGTEDVASMPLVSHQQHVVYRVKKAEKDERNPYDERWFIQMYRWGTERPTFSIIDYGPPCRDDEVVIKDDNGKLHVVNVARLGSNELPNLDKAAHWGIDKDINEDVNVEDINNVVNDKPMTFPRLTPARSREDAIALLESLRDGSMTYDDLEESDDAEPGDPFYLDDDEEDWQDTNVPRPPGQEAPVERAREDPRFQWERDRGISESDIDPEAERTKREAWVTGEQSKNPIQSGPMTEADLAERIKQLEKLHKKGGKR